MKKRVLLAGIVFGLAANGVPSDARPPAPAARALHLGGGSWHGNAGNWRAPTVPGQGRGPTYRSTQNLGYQSGFHAPAAKSTANAGYTTKVGFKARTNAGTTTTTKKTNTAQTKATAKAKAGTGQSNGTSQARIGAKPASTANGTLKGSQRSDALPFATNGTLISAYAGASPGQQSAITAVLNGQVMNPGQVNALRALGNTSGNPALQAAIAQALQQNAALQTQQNIANSLAALSQQGGTGIPGSGSAGPGGTLGNILQALSGGLGGLGAGGGNGGGSGGGSGNAGGFGGDAGGSGGSGGHTGGAPVESEPALTPEVTPVQNPETREASSQLARYDRRFLRVKNETKEKLAVFLQYETSVEDSGKWAWFPKAPNDGQAVVYHLTPGQEIDLSHDNWPVNARRVRLWGQSPSGAEYDEFKDRDLWLVDMANGEHAYYAAEGEAFDFTFSD